MIIDNEYIDESTDGNNDEYHFEEELPENEKCSHSAISDIEKEKVKTSKISVNPKLANAMLLITTLTIFHQIAKNNGFDVFEWMGDKLSPKKDNNYYGDFY